MTNSFDNDAAEADYETLASLAQDLVYRLPGCTDLMVRKTIQEVYRDFCRKTCALTSTVKVEMSGCENCRMLHARHSGCRVDCVTAVRVGCREIPKDEYRVVDGVLHVSNSYLSADGSPVVVSVDCVEIPRLGCETVPADFVEKHGDAIRSGVLARLMSMTGRAWSDQNMAALEMRSYENALTETRSRHHSGGQYSAGGLSFLGRRNIL